MSARNEHSEFGGDGIAGDSALVVVLRAPQREVESDDRAMDDEEKKRMRTRTANLRAVHKYRKRAKTEVVELREEAAQLEAQIEQLRERVSARAASRGHHQRSRSGDTLRLQASTPAIEDAATELRKLQQARSLNRRMKEALAKQRSDIATLERFLKTQVAKQDLSLAHGVERSLDASDVVANVLHSPTVYADLFQHLHDKVYKKTEEVLTQINANDVNCAFSSASMRHDASTGKAFGLATNTPIPCALHELETKLWNFLKYPLERPQGAAELTEEAFHRAWLRGSIRMEQQLTMRFRCSSEGIPTEGVSAIHKFAEPHRVVFAFSSLLTAADSGLLFRENAWLILSDAHVSGCSSAPTLFQTVYQLRAEPQESTTATSSSAPLHPSLHDAVLEAQSEKLSAYQNMLQHRLQHQFEEIRADGPLSSYYCK